MYTKWKDQILNYYVYIYIYLISTIINSLIFLFHVYCPHYFFSGSYLENIQMGIYVFLFFKEAPPKAWFHCSACHLSTANHRQMDANEGKTFRLHGTTWDYMGLHGTSWALAQSAVPQPIMAKYWSGSLHLKRK